MKKSMCALALTTAVMSTTAAAQNDNNQVCAIPLKLVGMQVKHDDVIFSAYDDGMEPVDFTLKEKSPGEDIVTLNDLVENGLMEQSVADFMKSDLMMGFINSRNGALSYMADQFESYNMLLTPHTYEVTVEQKGPVNDSIETTYNFLNPNDTTAFKNDHGNMAYSNATVVAGMLISTMQAYGSVDTCAIPRTELSSENGMLRPQARPQVRPQARPIKP